ncbi:hypothetical protein H4Q26_008046 [Puccinia striiformis f. sp. tritici PST-130]|nr:hypothetical protein H4Q26_008046 [Puccinia striiformis f. sp. tritici PST-130]
MQSLQEWLKVFLQRRKIEDLLQESVTYSNPQPETCAHLWDGSIWYTFQDAEGHWFNPMGNKISGKHHSVVRTIDWHREEAQAWKDATTHSQRDELLQKFGVQWSILNELPYWNPI